MKIIFALQILSAVRHPSVRGASIIKKSFGKKNLSALIFALLFITPDQANAIDDKPLPHLKTLTLWSIGLCRNETSLTVLEQFNLESEVGVGCMYVTAETSLPFLSAITTPELRPDLISFPEDQLGMASRAGIEKFSDALLQSIPKKYQTGYSEAIRIKSGEFYVVYYNKNLLEKVPESWDALEALQAEQKKELIAGPALIPYITTLFWQQHQVLEASSDSELINALFAASVDAKQLLGPKATLSVCEDPTDCHWNTELVRLFHAEEIPMMITGTWEFETLYRLMGSKLGIAALPSHKGETLRTLSIPKVMSLAKPADQHQQTIINHLIDFLLQPASQQMLFYSGFLDNMETLSAESEAILENLLALQEQAAYETSNLEQAGIAFEIMLPSYDLFVRDVISAEAYKQRMQRALTEIRERAK